MNEHDRISIFGGYGKDPYRIHINGKMSKRYSIEKRGGWWWLTDNEKDEEELLTLDEREVKIEAVGRIALREGFHSSYNEIVEGERAFRDNVDKEVQKSLLLWILLPILAVIGLFSYCNYESPSEIAEKESMGFHCLEAWDGSHYGFVQEVKTRMNDPGSFEHVETKVGSARGGRHSIYMTFRGRNAFGGIVTQVARGSYSKATCTATISSID